MNDVAAPFNAADYKVLRRLDRDGRTFYILGTAHISRHSVDEVRRLISALAPDTVCVELCQTRFEALADESRWRDLDIFEVIKQGKTLLLMANLALASFQRKLGDQFGVLPGAELRAAVEAAESAGATLVLADRDVQITLKRTWSNIPWLKRIMVMSGLMESLWSNEELSEDDLETLKEKDQLSELMAEFARQLPEVKTPLIDERDRFLMSKIEESPGDIVVAVVGAGHVDGMVEHFGTTVDRDRISQIPAKSTWSKLIKWIIPLLVLTAFYVGWTQHRGETFESMLQAWILPNSIMAAVGALIAGARPFSILTALIASPITSLNPMLGAGMVVGLVEAWLRKPTVADMESVNDDIKSLRGFYRNRFTRVLLVAILSTIGSALGAVIGVSWLLGLLAGASG